jgi:hypothetical protein
MKYGSLDLAVRVGTFGTEFATASVNVYSVLCGEATSQVGSYASPDGRTCLLLADNKPRAVFHFIIYTVWMRCVQKF